MKISKRKLLFYKPTHDGNEIHHELSNHQWDVYCANDIQQAADLNDEHTFYVGLCLIEKRGCIEKLKQINKLFCRLARINWIMALPSGFLPENTPESMENKLIAEYCYDYLTLPVDIKQLLFSLGHAYGMYEICLFAEKQMDAYPSRYGMIGKSSAMEILFRQLQKVVKEDCSVLIEGETGTGKELVVNAIHNLSARSKKPIVAINCGAFPKDLIQAELFGYEKGAFTGAQKRKIGRIESAQDGTLFLDEIGDLPLVQQVNLLRFIEEKAIVRIGGLEKIPVNVRVIAATHINLKEAVQKGQFREDLYYRLRMLQVNTPPLRERENDIELLTWYFFNKFSAKQRYKAKGFNSDSLHLLRSYDWPGNIRELMNCIRQALVMSDNRLLSPTDLGLEKRYKERTLQTLEEARAFADRESIITSLNHTNYNISRAAEVLGITRVSLYRLINKYNLEARRFPVC